ncbi:hypothetical protein [Rhodococcus sp. SMB37]|uniref:hypothetical protein n=1 Tax=Rhodococcus sp. SMB37 TaxID=2512213 RepID=UPI001050FCD7|nr:hypothetical protein [Rhodococcus sp. SMB37]
MEPVVDYSTRAVAEPLRGLVDGYLGYRMAGFPAGIHRGLPSRHMTFIVSIGAPIVVCAQTFRRNIPTAIGVYSAVCRRRPR